MRNGTETIEIVEPVKIESAPLPTKADLIDRGFTSKELESAEKRGMVSKEIKEDIKSEKNKDEVKSEEGKISPDKDSAKNDDIDKEKFKHSQQFKDADLTPDQESKLRELFPFVNGKMNPVESIYWRMKNERKARQKVEAEYKAYKEQNQRKDIPNSETERKDEFTDENGNIVDPEEQPLTVKQLKEMRLKEEKEAQEKHDLLQQKAAAVSESLRDQEDYAKSVYPDFEDTVNLAKDLMQNLDNFIQDAKTKNRIIALIRDLQLKASKADEMSLEDFNAADISYEIGKYHPEYGKKKEVLDPKANGGYKADKVRRVEETTQRRGSSAGLNGGSGKRTVAPDDVTREDLVKMDFKQRDSFKKNHPDQYAALLWG